MNQAEKPHPSHAAAPDHIPTLTEDMAVAQVPQAVSLALDARAAEKKALMALSDLVRTTMPWVTGVAQAGIGLGAFSMSTRHMRQFAAMLNFLW